MQYGVTVLSMVESEQAPQTCPHRTSSPMRPHVRRSATTWDRRPSAARPAPRHDASASHPLPVCIRHRDLYTSRPVSASAQVTTSPSLNSSRSTSLSTARRRACRRLLKPTSRQRLKVDRLAHLEGVERGGLAEIRRLSRSEGMTISGVARVLGSLQTSMRRALASVGPPVRQGAGRVGVDAFAPRIRELPQGRPVDAGHGHPRAGRLRNGRYGVAGEGAELRPEFGATHPASRTSYEPVEIMQCDLWPRPRGSRSVPGTSIVRRS